jgi:hypothetical protein
VGRRRLTHHTLPLLLLTTLGFLVMGYHPGFEDDAIYLAAVKGRLNAALYPHNADFFRLQAQATLFDNFMAAVVRGTGIPLAWAELLVQFAALFAILWACRRIAAHLFDELSAQWAAVATVAALFTLPVAGTALNIADQHLHPRNLATALILAAVSCILRPGVASQPGASQARSKVRSKAGSKLWPAALLLIAALLLHPIMAALGISFCLFLYFFEHRPHASRLGQIPTRAAAAPLLWIFAPASPAWRQALNSRSYYFIYRWTWYEWLGALAPLLLFWLLWRFIAQQHSGKPRQTLANQQLSRFAQAVFAYALFHQLLAMVLLAPPALMRVAPLQPMRYLQLVYIFLALIAGGLVGQLLLKQSLLRWALYLTVLNGTMFAVQWQTVDAGAHLELPGQAPANPWLQAFDWIRLHTPTDAYFALDPHYLAAPDEGYHGFRALAERSQLADAIKDTAVVVQVPSLAAQWQTQQRAQANWPHFQLADFLRLKSRFGVDWVLASYPAPPGLTCSWHNASLAVCQIP